MTTEADRIQDMHKDIAQRFDSPFVVVGFFTPDYEPAATAFSENLAAHRITHHLFARPKLNGAWSFQTRQKPGVLVDARKTYPDEDLVLMDVDCRVRGDINGIIRSPGDVALRTKYTSLGSVFVRRYALKPCSRVMLVRPTPGSAAFIAAWKAACDSQMGGCDEALLMRSMADSSEHYSVGTLSLGYAGMELRDAPADAPIVHESIRDTTRPFWTVRKLIQKYFRVARDAVSCWITGKTYKENLSRSGR